MKMCTEGIHIKPHLAALCIACAILLPSFAYASRYGDMYLRFLEGDVQVKTEDAAEWLPASINMPLINGDHIWVPDNGRAELMFRNGTVIRLDRNSYLEILSTDEGRSGFYLVTGHTYVYTKLGASDTAVFRTPTASFYARGHSIARIDAFDGENSAAVSVFLGAVYADDGAGQIKINPGSKIVFSKNDSYPRLAAIAPPDQWERWNRQRDREFGPVPSTPVTAYLPDELSAYYYDFKKNGRWVYEPEYGYVWIPTAIVMREWSPYRIGRWVWMHGDYVWISYEPWGWVPHHYGRWAFIPAIGWCWIPPARGAVYWGPGFVGWARTSTYISWVPLAPGEPYYGYGNYGPHSINIRNTHFRVPPVYNDTYRNTHVHNAVTTLHRDTFMTGKSTATGVVPDNPFLKEKHIMSPPDMKPERTAIMPVMKDIPRTKKPPQQVIDRTSGPRGMNNDLEPVRIQKNVPSLTSTRKDGRGQINNSKGKVSQTPLGPWGGIPQTPSAGSDRLISSQEPKKENRPRNITPSVNARPLSAAKSANRTATASPQPQVQVPERGDKAAGYRSIPSQNMPKETKTFLQGPSRIPVSMQEKKIEAPKRNLDVPAMKPQVKREAQRQQTPQRSVNMQQTPPSSSKVRPTTSRLQSQPQKPENIDGLRKIERTPRMNATKNISPEQNSNNFTKNFRTEMRQKRQ